jgi:hypothetical protein
MKKITRLRTCDRFCLSHRCKGSITLTSPTHFKAWTRDLRASRRGERRQDQSALDLFNGFLEVEREYGIADGPS